MPDSPVDLSFDGPLAVVTLNAPPLNLFTPEMMAGLKSAVAGVVNSDARAVLLQAEGRAVSGGVDVNFFTTLDAVTGAQVWRDWFEFIHALEDLAVPTVFAVHALCLTAAFEISLACDLILAAESARFGLVEIVVGLTPSMGGPQRLVERAGLARARELIYTGELFGAATLERWNVVNRVLPDEGFREAAHAFALRLANGPTRAHAATKLITAAAARHGSRAADDLTPLVSGALFASEDLQNATASFLTDGPGKATYTGR